MVKDQHEKIKGYRDLSEDEIALMNKIKAKAEEVRELVEEIQRTPQTDGRWTSIGMTHLQQGFMAVTRAVARPTTF